ncbi:MAG: GNAT family N-acetyltransferase [Pseudomonadota bacterium]
MAELPPGYRVRVARPDDAGAMRELRHAVLCEGGWFATLPSEQRATVAELRAALTAQLQQANSLVLCAWSGARLAGFVSIHGEPLARMAHVGRLEILLAAQDRGHGLGTALLAEAVARSARGGVLRKLSLAVFADNAAALALYRRVGFVEEGRRVGEYRMEDGAPRDDVLMALWVG